MIRAIVFDCFGVLTADTWREFTATLPQGEIVQKARDLNASYDAGFLTLEQFMNEVQALTGRTPELVEQLASEKVAKNTTLLHYIAELKERYKIGLLSNIATSWIQDSFLSKDELALFDAQVLSYEVGMTKPDSRIFELICQRLGVAPEEAVMVDDIDRYCSAAEAVGMKAVVYTDFANLKQQLDVLLADSNH